MAIFNEIQERTFNDVLADRLNLTGSAPSPAIAPEVFPGITLESDRPEWGYNKGESHCAGTASVAANVGFRSSVTLWNPILSGRIVTVTAMQLIVTAGSAQARLGWFTPGAVPPGAVSTNRNRLDGRFRAGAGANQRPTAQLITDNATVVLANNAFLSRTTSFDIVFSQVSGIVIPPGSVLYLSPASDNVAITECNLLWRERQAQPRELV